MFKLYFNFNLEQKTCLGEYYKYKIYNTLGVYTVKVLKLQLIKIQN